MVEIALPCERWLEKQELGNSEEDSAELEDDAQETLQQVSLLGKVATGEGAGRQVRRVQRLGGEAAVVGACERSEQSGDQG